MSSPIALVRRFFGGASASDADSLHVDYQASVDLLFAWIGSPQKAHNIEVEPGVYVRVDPVKKRVVGIEILDCATRFHVNPDSIDRSFAEAKLKQFSAPALAQVQP